MKIQSLASLLLLAESSNAQIASDFPNSCTATSPVTRCSAATDCCALFTKTSDSTTQELCMTQTQRESTTYATGYTDSSSGLSYTWECQDIGAVHGLKMVGASALALAASIYII
mmetsp:Transcript_10976/g.18353  ORF Transcript_10976/g.18353 Transcript_10976/m.18353 type:complete len:114 (-) Transcript_10976:119-460(-)|eukprot:CAMPEP_0168613846 /NCGR_PEP_ID=MMETSP0449_2-20121227/3663_1 /TAXON_ID=1082188 /ORGANISM="Strombidium rassoulzadegani, Strain ras09" /LENGTH=113 /DNA_ID=CAMNT_0008654495 /DNA_START=7 /DNA_END=348 /DNA_ORIENTATION=-